MARARTSLIGLGLWAAVSHGHGPARAEAPAGPLFADLAVPVSDILRALGEAPALHLRPVGTTTPVFRMDLDGDIDAAFKPQSRSHPRGHLAEVAAFRLGRALGMTNVAPAMLRNLTVERMKALLDPAEQPWDSLEAQLVISPGQAVEGAVMYWVPDMHESGFDTPQGMAHFRRWLSQEDGDPPSREKSKVVAAQISTMIAFDALIGNWDRFSGGNVQGDKGGRHLFVRDHNVAFDEPISAERLARLMGRLKQVQRFSRSFVEAVRKLDAAALQAALRDPADPAGVRLLTDRQLAGVLDRRETLLSYVAALLDRYGEAQVLTFP